MSSGQIPKPLNKQQIQSIDLLIDEVSSRQLKDFGNIGSEIKADGSLITECDRWSDETFVRELSRITPNEGVLSEEGSKSIPISNAFWVVDPLDGTTNFAAGIPHWAISVARFVNGMPESAFLDLPALNQRIYAVKGQGVWLNKKRLDSQARFQSESTCVSLCSRSIRVLQRKPNQPFPGKIRLRGVASLNLASVAVGQTVGAIEATPKIWDIASAWLVLSELNCPLKWLANDPSKLMPGEDVAETSFPLLTASSENELLRLLPWAEELIEP